MLIALLLPATVHAATLYPVTLKAWEHYIEFATGRAKQGAGPGGTFLWLDGEPDRLARVRAGEIVVSPAGPGNPRQVPSGLIHDWVGGVFIANVTLKDVLRVVNDYAHYKDWYPPAVIDSKVIASTGEKDRFSMLVVNKSFLMKSALELEYESWYVPVDVRCGLSISRTVRMQQIEDYGTPGQHVLPEGEGSGAIWRLFTITRYFERDGGVYLEREAIGLSRDIPGALRWVAGPVIRRVSQATLATSLRQTEAAVRDNHAPVRKAP